MWWRVSVTPTLWICIWWKTKNGPTFEVQINEFLIGAMCRSWNSVKYSNRIRIACGRTPSYFTHPMLTFAERRCRWVKFGKKTAGVSFESFSWMLDRLEGVSRHECYDAFGSMELLSERFQPRSSASYNHLRWSAQQSVNFLLFLLLTACLAFTTLLVDSPCLKPPDKQVSVFSIENVLCW